MKFKQLIAVVGILLVLAACSEEKAAKPADPVMESRKDLEEALPILDVTIDGREQPTIRGGYSWSFFDEKENVSATIETESLSPLELAENQKAPKVNEETTIDLHFDKQPDSCYVQIWDSEGVTRGPFDDIVLDEPNGKTVYQIIAEWEQGTATYVFSLTVE
ncbi:hypothetical protein QMA04_01350 [Planococcus sp. APC 3900]|uniref:hypothetical protein n=1 Tax=Planococcus sp. APC 3900 TaxID=3035191 RepID=UPI0025B3CDF7|nr:hypothetical protein [Planococcus sp. APC 3900]MDN3436712.1 hypothetical protein [Planococcus sp. APC 3900]